MNLFEHLKNISYEKKENDNFSDYSQFMINRFLAFAYDCSTAANVMNNYNGIISNYAHQFFLLNTIRKKKRYFGYTKANKIEDLKYIMDYYNVSRRIAEKYLEMLTPSQVKNIKNYFEEGKGGKNGK